MKDEFNKEVCDARHDFIAEKFGDFKDSLQKIESIVKWHLGLYIALVSAIALAVIKGCA